MLALLRHLLAPDHPLRLVWHFVANLVGAIYHRYPSRELVTIGVTGTNGKTTTASLIAHILTVAGYRTALVTTEQLQIGERRWKNTDKFTTAGRGGTNRFLRTALDAGCTHAVVEVSSHALSQYRTLGVEWDAAVLTNVTPDHLDYHHTFAEYRDTKTLLFWQLAQSRKAGERIAVLPADDESIGYFQRIPLEGEITYGLDAGDVRARNLRVTNTTQTFTVAGWDREFALTTTLPGTFNVRNILAATSCTLGLGVRPESIQKAVATFTPVAGRMEAISVGQPYRVFVDFAHTPDALEKVLRAVRATTTGRVIVVFGVAGDRPREFRTTMGVVADRHADLVIVTTDDPYDADPVEIIADIAKGVTKKTDATLILEADRRRGIITALKHAKSHDVIVIAGKGAQVFQYVAGGEKRAWDDREIAKTEIKRILKKSAHAKITR